MKTKFRRGVINVLWAKYCAFLTIEFNRQWKQFYADTGHNEQKLIQPSVQLVTDQYHAAIFLIFEKSLEEFLVENVGEKSSQVKQFQVLDVIKTSVCDSVNHLYLKKRNPLFSKYFDSQKNLIEFLTYFAQQTERKELMLTLPLNSTNFFCDIYLHYIG